MIGDFMEFQKAVLYCSLEYKNSESFDDLILYLKSKGFDILTSIKIIREALGISLGDAKQLVAGSIAWKTEAQAYDDVHQELIEQIKNQLATENKPHSK
jgi:ribosomal protein L7/L12